MPHPAPERRPAARRVPEDHLARLFDRVQREHATRPATRVITDGHEQVWTHGELRERVRALAASLVRHGVQPGDRVAILSPNRPEWSVVDLACLAVRAVPVPVYATSTPAQARQVLEHSESVAVVTGDGRLHELVTGLLADLPALRLVACTDEVEGVTEPWQQLLASPAPEHLAEVDRRTAEARPDEVATIVYTSGTTGTPKGVALTHAAMIHQVHAVDSFFPYGPHESSLAFLPLSHAFERAWTYFVLSHGALNTYVRDPKTVAAQMLVARPTSMVAVPRLYETVYARAHAMVAGSPVKQAIFDWSFRVGRRAGALRAEGRALPAALRARLAVADRLVLHNVRDAIGGPKSVLAAGGAPLRQEVEEFFWAAGVLVSQGYGMTETGPLMTFNCPSAFRFGTAGRVIVGGEMRVGEEGELLYRGPNVMAGYWRDEEATAEAIVDGWLRTGDIGEIDEDGYVRITDRLKDLIVTIHGKNVAPAPIESRLAEHPLVEHAVVIGDDRPCLVALVAPAEDADPAAALQAAREQVERVNADLPHHEQVRAVELLDVPVTMEDGLLTPTLKVRRRAVEARCRETVDRMYADLQAARARGR